LYFFLKSGHTKIVKILKIKAGQLPPSLQRVQLMLSSA